MSVLDGPGINGIKEKNASGFKLVRGLQARDDLVCVIQNVSRGTKFCAPTISRNFFLDLFHDNETSHHLRYCESWQSGAAETFPRPRVLSLVSSGFANDAHAAFAELFQDFVVQNGLADHGSNPIFLKKGA